jgi:hypothetical protein
MELTVDGNPYLIQDFINPLSKQHSAPNPTTREARCCAILNLPPSKATWIWEANTHSCIPHWERSISVAVTPAGVLIEISGD